MTSTRQLPAHAQWELAAGRATFRAGSLTGMVDVGHTNLGIYDLRCGDVKIDGLVLGVTAENLEKDRVRSGLEAVVRGDDLIVQSRESSEPPFSWQVSWRASTAPQEVVLLDMIVSVQTQHLESFPRLSICSELPGGKIWSVGSDGNAMQLRDDQQMVDSVNSTEVTDECAGCVVLQMADCDWSYAEMNRPGVGQGGDESWKINCSDRGRYLIRRPLGGDFLEKGVLRRWQVRGAFLPRQNDLALAAASLRQLSAEQPPLSN